MGRHDYLVEAVDGRILLRYRAGGVAGVSGGKRADIRALEHNNAPAGCGSPSIPLPMIPLRLQSGRRMKSARITLVLVSGISATTCDSGPRRCAPVPQPLGLSPITAGDLPAGRPGRASAVPLPRSRLLPRLHWFPRHERSRPGATRPPAPRQSSAAIRISACATAAVRLELNGTDCAYPAPGLAREMESIGPDPPHTRRRTGTESACSVQRGRGRPLEV